MSLAAWLNKSRQKILVWVMGLKHDSPFTSYLVSSTASILGDGAAFPIDTLKVHEMFTSYLLEHDIVPSLY